MLFNQYRRAPRQDCLQDERTRRCLGWQSTVYFLDADVEGNAPEDRPLDRSFVRR